MRTRVIPLGQSGARASHKPKAPGLYGNDPGGLLLKKDSQSERYLAQHD